MVALAQAILPLRQAIVPLRPCTARQALSTDHTLQPLLQLGKVQPVQRTVLPARSIPQRKWYQICTKIIQSLTFCIDLQTTTTDVSDCPLPALKFRLRALLYFHQENVSDASLNDSFLYHGISPMRDVLFIEHTSRQRSRFSRPTIIVQQQKISAKRSNAH
jgi:hypothetical protein